MRLAARMADQPSYIFAEADRRLRSMAARGVPVLNFGPGSPDLPPPDWIIEAMTRAAHAPGSHRYPGYTGTPALRRAWAGYYARRFGVTLDPEREVLPLIGSKDGVAHVHFALVDPGDLVLIPDPGYPTYERGVRLAGGEPYLMPLRPDLGFLPDLDEIPPAILDRAVAMWLNYPNNPTGAIAPVDFYQQAVDLALRHDFALLSDNPYAEICYDGYRAPSLLEIEGAREVAVELNSVSKTYNMAGWRIGVAVGNAALIGALLQIKSNVDSGIFLPLQAGAVAALEGDHDWIAGRNRIYEGRRDVGVRLLRAAGFDIEPPAASLYLWPRVPAGEDSAALALRVLEETGVWITPGGAFGPSGADYLRVALCSPEEELVEGLGRMVALMTG